MAWTTPRTWIANELVTTSFMNTHVRDNMNAVGDGPRARVYQSANQSLTSGTAAYVPFDSERYDTDTIHDNATNNTRLTCKSAGTYLIGGCVNWSSAAGGRRDLFIVLNNVTNIVYDLRDGSANGNTVMVSTIYALAVNDYVELRVFQNSGGSLNIVATPNYSPEFWIQRLSV